MIEIFMYENATKTGERCISLFPENFKTPIYSPKHGGLMIGMLFHMGKNIIFQNHFLLNSKSSCKKCHNFSMQSQYTTLVTVNTP